MKRILLYSFLLLTLFALTACVRQYAACSANVVSFVFAEDDVLGYTPTGANLITESGDEMVIYFSDFRPQKIEIEGSLTIIAGTDGVSVSPNADYRLMFSMGGDAKLILQVGSTIRVIEKKQDVWVPDVP